MQNNPFAHKAQYYLNESHRLNEELSAELEYNALLEEILILALNEGFGAAALTALAPGAARLAGAGARRIGQASGRIIQGAKTGAKVGLVAGALAGGVNNDSPLHGAGLPAAAGASAGLATGSDLIGDATKRLGHATVQGAAAAPVGAAFGAGAGLAASALGRRGRAVTKRVGQGIVGGGKPILRGIGGGLAKIAGDVGGGISDALPPKVSGAIGTGIDKLRIGTRSVIDQAKAGYNGGSDLQATSTPKLLGTDDAPTRGPAVRGTKGKRKTGNQQFESTSLDVLSSVLHELYTSGRITENQIITCEASLRGLVRKVAPYVAAAGIGAGVMGVGAQIAKPMHNDIQKVAQLEFEKGVDNLSSNPLTHPVDATKKGLVAGAGIVDRATPYLARALNTATNAVADTTGWESARTKVSTESPGIRDSMRDSAIKPHVDAAQQTVTNYAAGAGAALGGAGLAAVRGTGAAAAAWRRRRRGTTPTAGTVAEDIMKILMKRR